MLCSWFIAKGVRESDDHPGSLNFHRTGKTLVGRRVSHGPWLLSGADEGEPFTRQSHFHEWAFLFFEDRISERGLLLTASSAATRPCHPAQAGAGGSYAAKPGFSPAWSGVYIDDTQWTLNIQDFVRFDTQSAGWRWGITIDADPVPESVNLAPSFVAS